jgi:hypothetical protein
MFFFVLKNSRHVYSPITTEMLSNTFAKPEHIIIMDAFSGGETPYKSLNKCTDIARCL